VEKEKPIQADTSDDDSDEELPDVNEPLPGTSSATNRSKEQIETNKGDSSTSGGAAKRFRANWDWSPDDIPHKPSPAHKFIVKGLDEGIPAVGYFMSLFGVDTIQLILQETNRLHFKQSGRTPPILEREIRQFLGITMYMSVVSLPDRRMYWAKDYRVDIIADIMTRDRFEEILRLLHFSNSDLQPASDSCGYDKLYKIRAVLDSIGAHFMEFVDFEPHLSIDEQMVPFKGKHGLKNYMKGKPCKWGYKVFALAGRSGYIYRQGSVI
jgi:hypothetical protein